MCVSVYECLHVYQSVRIVVMFKPLWTVKWEPVTRLQLCGHVLENVLENMLVRITYIPNIPGFT